MNKKMIASAMAIALATTANAAIVKTTPKPVKHKGVEKEQKSFSSTCWRCNYRNTLLYSIWRFC